MLDAHVIKRRSQFTIDASVRLAAGDTCGLFGMSGSGKSTILGCIAGADVPDGGFVKLEGATLFPPSVALHHRSIGYLAQNSNVFPHLRVAQNVWYGVSAQAAQDGATWIAELRERLQLAAIWHEPGAAISGGQARRVALARMLARKPRLVLLDEPFNGLDRPFVRELLAAIGEWQQRFGFTMLVVDHAADVLERLCSRAIALANGRVIQTGPWSELHARPATAELARLLGPL